MNLRRQLLLAAPAWAALAAAPHVRAQSTDFPTKPIKIIVPFPPGAPVM